MAVAKINISTLPADLTNVFGRHVLIICSVFVMDICPPQKKSFDVDHLLFATPTKPDAMLSAADMLVTRRPTTFSHFHSTCLMGWQIVPFWPDYLHRMATPGQHL